MSVKLTKVDSIQRRLLPYPDAAAYLGLSTKTLRNKISLGALPFRPKRIASKPLFDVRDLDRFIDSLGGED
jgi:predicted DNA-binding transcriptional regulator AlpA